MTADDYFPLPSNTPLRGGPTLRWGVVGPGGIASHWVRAVRDHTDQPVVAVASRSLARAAAFAQQHEIPRAFGTVEQLLEDPGVDAVYVATPHSEHRRVAVLAAGAGKHILIEKPIGVSADEAIEIKTAARAAGVIAAEAMWTRYLPGLTVIEQLIRRGDLGEVRLATADVGWAVTREQAPRLYDPDLGGGALLDMGVYAVWFAHFAIGAIEDVQATGSFVDTGVDDQVAAVLRGSAGRMATVTTSMSAYSTGLGTIAGTHGAVRFLDPMVFPARFAVATPTGEHLWQPTGPLMREGLAYPAPAIAQAVAEGRSDSPIHPIDSTIDVMRTLDAIRDLIAASPETAEGRGRES